MDKLTANLKQQTETLKQELHAQKNQIEKLRTISTTQATPVEKFIDQIIPIFAQMIDMRVSVNISNSDKIAQLAKQIAIKLNLNNAAINTAYHAGWLHNIGMIGLKDDVITTPYKSLSKEQKQELDSSPLKAETLLISIPQFKHLAQVLRNQYERHDGHGYPDQLSGDDIPTASRILAVAVDYYEMQNGIFFGEKVSAQEAFTYIKNAAGKKYNPRVVDAFESVANGMNSSKTDQLTTRELSLKSLDIEAGMKLTQNLMLDDEMLLLGTGQILTETLIDRVRNLEKRLNKNFIFHIETQINADS